jgi:hypothetical protein
MYSCMAFDCRSAPRSSADDGTSEYIVSPATASLDLLYAYLNHTQPAIPVDNSTCKSFVMGMIPADARVALGESPKPRLHGTDDEECSIVAILLESKEVPLNILHPGLLSWCESDIHILVCHRGRGCRRIEHHAAAWASSHELPIRSITAICQSLPITPRRETWVKYSGTLCIHAAIVPY